MTPREFSSGWPRNIRRSDNRRRTQMQMPIPTWKLLNLLPEE